MSFKRSKSKESDRVKRSKGFKFRNLRIGSKYGLILGVVIGLFIISSIIVYLFMDKSNENIEAMDRRADRAIDVAEMGSLVRAKAIRVFRYIQEPEAIYTDEYNERKEALEVLEMSLEDKMDTAEEQALFDLVVKLDDQLNRQFNEIISMIGQGENGVAEMLGNDANQTQIDAVNALEELRLLVNSQRDSAYDQVETGQTAMLVAQGIAIIISVIVSLILIIYTTRSVSSNLSKVVAVSNQVADGDLRTERLEYESKDEIGQLSSSVNKMAENLRDIIGRVANVSDTVSAQSEELTQSSSEVKSGNEQIASTMQELASGTETQANHAGDVASKMSDFSGKVKEANDNGQIIHGASQNVLDMTKEGQEMMQGSISQMGRVNTIVKDAVGKVEGLDVQSKEISKLVSVIKDIAEQTNLLALNAAIESARAGEHGRGFAVVADEVRKLAEQVASSVTDITGIVKNIQSESSAVSESLKGGYQEVEEGTAQIEETGETFKKINGAVQDMVTSIQTVTGNLADISTSSQEIHTSVEEIASISEESAAGVEETSASAEQASSSMEEVSDNAEQLAKLSEELNGLVKKFKL
ncbi:methyl-accepting chemotaxis protein [Saliterribacillus persicus]